MGKILGSALAVFVFALFTLLFLNACASQAPANVPGVNDAVQPPAAPAPAQAPPVAPTPEASPPILADPAVVALFDRLGQVKSYSFTVAKLPDRRAGHTYSVKGDKIRIDVLRDLYSKDNIDVIFLDMAAQTATGYCVTPSTCPDPNKAFPLNYSDWIVPLPPSWAGDIETGRIVGTLTFEDRPVTIVRYTKYGQYFEAYVDNYYGFPMRVAVANDSGMATVVGGWEYRDIVFNKVADAQVTHQNVSVQ